ncbi:hypothetical protein [Phytohalomonas tamaricis]|uniref:hypothetical protein n=1 Tax=Phytohalomonas tamaricis TaxID=2081032 RepID=UPI001319FF2A|nr:hypothetical protein [Phytohalomonas tamaricis]
MEFHDATAGDTLLHRHLTLLMPKRLLACPACSKYAPGGQGQHITKERVTWTR